MGKWGGSSLPFSLPSFPFSPETPDTQANDRHSKELKSNSCSVASKLEWFVDKFMKGPEICFVCLFVCFFVCCCCCCFLFSFSRIKVIK